MNIRLIFGRANPIPPQKKRFLTQKKSNCIHQTKSESKIYIRRVEAGSPVCLFTDENKVKNGKEKPTDLITFRYILFYNRQGRY